MIGSVADDVWFVWLRRARALATREAEEEDRGRLLSRGGDLGHHPPAMRSALLPVYHRGCGRVHARHAAIAAAAYTLASTNNSSHTTLN